MRTLVIHTAFPGDLILMSPLLERLRQDSDLEWLGLVLRPACAPLFQGDPRLDALIVYDKNGADRGLRGLHRMIHRLQSLQPDRVICPHRSLRSGLLAWFSGAYERIGFSTATGSLAYTELVIDNRALHEIDRNLSLAGGLVEGETEFPVLLNDPAEEAGMRELFEHLGLVFPVAIAPASLWATKRWPARHFGALADLIMEATPADIVLLGGPQDRTLCLEVAACAHSCRRKRIHVLAGELGLRESYQALRLCRLAIVNDSAPLHLAQAARIPTFAMFGSTIPGFGFGPRGPRDRVFQLELDCIPCGIHGRRKCPLNTLACMEDLSPERILPAVIEELATSIGIDSSVGSER